MPLSLGVNCWNRWFAIVQNVQRIFFGGIPSCHVLSFYFGASTNPHLCRSAGWLTDGSRSMAKNTFFNVVVGTVAKPVTRRMHRSYYNARFVPNTSTGG